MANLPPSKRRGSGFVNLGRYLQANKGSRVGQAVQSGLQSQIGQFKSGLSGAQESFQKGIQAGTVGTDADKQMRQQILEKISGLGQKAQVFGTGEDDTPDIISEGDIGSFAKFRGGQYTGPQSLENESRFLNQSRALEQIGNATRSEGGRIGLLQQYIGGGRQPYTAGQQRLDSMLLGTQGADLGKIRRGTRGIGQQTQNLVDTSRGLAGVQAAKSAEFGKQTQEQLTGKQGLLTQEQEALQKAVSDAQLKRQSDIDAFMKALQERDSEKINYHLRNVPTYGVDPSDPRFYSVMPESAVSAGAIITPEQQARLEALSRLSGKQLDIPEVSDERYDPSKTMPIFDIDKFDLERRASKDNFEKNVLNRPENMVQIPSMGPVNIREAVNYFENQMQRLYDPVVGPMQGYDWVKSEYERLKPQLDSLYKQYGVSDIFK